MADLTRALQDTRVALAEMAEAAERSGARWTAPRAPGKWSPSQVVEHVALSFEESAKVLAGQPSRFPRLPSLIRPVVRAVFFRRVLDKGAFPKARTNRAMNPDVGPSTPAEGRVRLEQAFARFERESVALHAAGRPVPSEVFGPVSVPDYARFQELHTRHHLKQMR
jgi:hypothetical protein